jgi:glycosyltransferase involved in cell wall biosynthesis
MKVLVLTKRQYMGKDLLHDRFGRFRELPLGLAQLGHEVTGIACSYRRREEGVILDSDPSLGGVVTWHSINAVNGLTPQLGKFANQALKLAADFQPDLIWSCSDAYQVIFGAWLAKRTRAKCVVDLYDNFEAFGASQVPGILPLFRRAVREVEGVTFFSRRLADYVTLTYHRTGTSEVIENGVRKDLFFPRSREVCRQQLGLPKDAQIIGTAGALHGSRGIETLFRAFERMAAEYDDLHLALAGPRKNGLAIPQTPRIHDFKVLRHEDIPVFVSALDVAVICYRQSAQGEFSFPQKAYEIMACRVPLIAAAVGAVNELLEDNPSCLYQPENAESLAESILRQLKKRVIVDGKVPSWADSAQRLEGFFAEVIGAHANRSKTEPGIETEH